MANSALYGGMKVSQLDAAVIRIGLRELKELATAMSVLAAFRSKEPVQGQLHERSVLSGGIANKVAKATRLQTPSTASTCGLLSEIGAMACFAADAKEYGKLWRETYGNGPSRVARERERYGVTSFEVGRRFLERNGLPEEVYSTVGAELGSAPEQYTPEQRILSDCTAFIGALAHDRSGGRSRDRAAARRARRQRGPHDFGRKDLVRAVPS
ncbi:MAG: HDOD domain-containing protein [Polyangiaceae bacterium]